MTYRFNHCASIIDFKYFDEQYPISLNEVVDVATKSNFQLRSSFENLNCPSRTTDNGQFALPYLVITFWNKTLETLMCSKILKSS